MLLGIAVDTVTSTYGEDLFKLPLANTFVFYAYVPFFFSLKFNLNNFCYSQNFDITVCVSLLETAPVQQSVLFPIKSVYRVILVLDGREK